MSKFRFGVRVMLITIAFGLFSVSVCYRISNFGNEIPVELPEVQTDSPIIVYPKSRKNIPFGGGGG